MPLEKSLADDSMKDFGDTVKDYELENFFSNDQMLESIVIHIALLPQKFNGYDHDILRVCFNALHLLLKYDLQNQWKFGVNQRMMVNFKGFHTSVEVCNFNTPSIHIYSCFIPSD